MKLDLNKLKESVGAAVYSQPNLRADVDLSSHPYNWVPATDFSQVFNYKDIRPEGVKDVLEAWPWIEKEANWAWEFGSGKPLYR